MFGFQISYFVLMLQLRGFSLKCACSIKNTDIYRNIGKHVFSDILLPEGSRGIEINISVSPPAGINLCSRVLVRTRCINTRPLLCKGSVGEEWAPRYLLPGGTSPLKEVYTLTNRPEGDVRDVFGNA